MSVRMQSGGLGARYRAIGRLSVRYRAIGRLGKLCPLFHSFVALLVSCLNVFDGFSRGVVWRYL